VRILIVCGGTGGHIFPAVALAQELKRQGYSDLFFIVDKSHNAESMMKASGFDHCAFNVPKMPYGISLKWFGFLSKLVRSRIEAETLIARINPDIAVGFGAYISGPIIQSASAMGIKTVIHEQNVVFGRANYMLRKIADKVCLSFDHPLIHKGRKYVFTGNPIRQEMINGLKMVTRHEALSALKFSDKRKTLFIIGGSLGASAINKAVSDMAAMLNIVERDSIQIAHITGYADREAVEESYRVNKIVHWVRGFCDKMVLCYKAADLVICRAGATTISELAFFAIPAVFIPYPGAGGHQSANALCLAKRQAAVVLPQSQLQAGRLKDEVFSIINNNRQMEQMRSNMRLFSRPQAGSELAGQIIELINAQ
jgi:UDP-N-acetylglucosamine--N-acetylmuramyl-(pentapeptide) pyrophosphoryl-undecaprenol N-acetylglucosamine transferase